MSAKLDRLKQQTEQQESQQTPTASPGTDPILTSLLDAIEKQNTLLDTVIDRQGKLELFVRAMNTELPGRLSQALPDTAPSSTGSEPPNSEIRSVLTQMLEALNAEKLNSAASSLESRLQQLQSSVTGTMASVSKQARAREAQADKLIANVGKVAGSLHRTGREEMETARKEAVDAIREQGSVAAEVVTKRLDGANTRAAKIQAGNEHLEARQLWSSAAAMCLTLLPVAVVLLGVWSTVSALVSGWGWVLATDISLWMHLGRGFVVVLGTMGALFALHYSVRWVASLVGTWAGNGMPKWPLWRRK